MIGWSIEFTCVCCGHRADDNADKDGETWLCLYCEEGECMACKGCDKKKEKAGNGTKD